MDWLNFHHLRYFWSVAREGSLRRAAETLGISQPSISAQVRQLEEALGEKLFRRSGRGLALTDAGKMVFDYADQIFSVGRELLSAVRQKSPGRLAAFNVGITDSVPKLVAREILKPVFQLAEPFRMVCREGKIEALLPQLAQHRLDLVLADEPSPSSLNFKTFNHPLGGCGVSFCAAPKLAARLRRGFPGSLHEAPALLPSENTSLRHIIQRWFDRHAVQPRVLAEFEDTALMRVFAVDGEGFFPVHSVAVAETVGHYGFKVVGEAEDCRNEFFAITAERRLRHPAIIAVTENAQLRLFA
ncbi:MAG: LysR family transcriptional regulator, transcriptional activator of nhaA [Chthoniobacter sp.]|jgi:LysR family transcriptional activator of nhaA|nr:LysR family transcriptional regulator, transcriptional activator of nhaA [Chthoniobacter sp.]